MYVAAIILLLGFEMAFGVKPTPMQDALALRFLAHRRHGADRDLHRVRRHQSGRLDRPHPGLAHVRRHGITRSGTLLAPGRLGSGRDSRGCADPAVVRARVKQRARKRDARTCLTSGIENRPGAGFWENVKNVLNTEYTLLSAFLGSIVRDDGHARHRPGHGAADAHRERPSPQPLALISSGLADIPIALCFTLIGVLLWVYYQCIPTRICRRKIRTIFVYYILRVLPTGIRGVIVAGLFATAMGSLSTALNALATSFTRGLVSTLHPPRGDAEPGFESCAVEHSIFRAAAHHHRRP